MQAQFNDLSQGEFLDAGTFFPTGKTLPALDILQVEDVKTILVTKRANKQAGVGINIAKICDIAPGDRITVTGRFKSDAPSGSWGVALIAKDGTAENQLAHQIAPRSVFSLSHVLEKTEMDAMVVLHTTSWGHIEPNMDFFVDNLRISREVSESNILADTRGIVYSMSDDRRMRDYKSLGLSQDIQGTEYLQGSGNPKIKIIKRGKLNILHVSNRFRDFDAVDIMLNTLKLMKGNSYQVTATGRIDGKAPEGSLMLMQSTPGYSWLASKFVSEGSEFSLTFTLTPSGIEKWTAIRISSNVIGASVSFFIFSIEVESLGVH
jgi:hypothetical protein